MEVRLLHASVLDGDLAVQRRGKPEHDRAFGLQFDGQRVDHMAGIDRRYHPVHPHLAVGADRGVDDLRTNAALRIVKRHAAKGSRRERCAPSGPLGGGLEHRKLPWLFRQEPASEQIRIEPRCKSHLVDEALFEECVLRMVDAAPHPDRDMAIAHREIDEIVRHLVGHVFQQPLQEIAVDPELHHSRRYCRDDGLA